MALFNQNLLSVDLMRPPTVMVEATNFHDLEDDFINCYKQYIDHIFHPKNRHHPIVQYSYFCGQEPKNNPTPGPIDPDPVDPLPVDNCKDSLSSKTSVLENIEIPFVTAQAGEAAFPA